MPATFDQHITKSDEKGRLPFSPSMWIEHHPFFSALFAIAILVVVVYVLRHAATQTGIAPPLTTGTTGGSYIPPGPSGIAGPPGPAGAAGTPGTIGYTIRAAGSVPAFAAYDKANPQGVPLRKTPGGLNAGYAPFGSPITPLGPNVNGWWQTATGYVSANDVVIV